MTLQDTVLIAGATGVVGTAAVEHFASLPRWQVLALSRRPTAFPPGVQHVPANLTDAVGTRAALSALSQVTHVVFAALYERPDLVAGWRDPEQMAVNLAMFRNLLDAIQPVARRLRHITLLQGAKAYGSHIEPIRNPAKERWPRHNHANFYWLQEDLLREQQPHRDWTFTILRPQVLFGYAVGSPMNVLAAVGAYAAILRELGRPLRFPGGGLFINGATDTRLLARAMAFVGTNPAPANETFNVTNGDALVWQDLWSSIADHFGMKAGDPQPLRLAEAMPGYEEVWERIVAKHSLQPLTLAGLVGSSWQFTDRVFGYGNLPRATRCSARSSCARRVSTTARTPRTRCCTGCAGCRSSGCCPTEPACSARTRGAAPGQQGVGGSPHRKC
jgi:nucleoside-diphosphate-sugar epimerase